MPNGLTHFYIFEKTMEEVSKEYVKKGGPLKPFFEAIRVGLVDADKVADENKPSLKSILKTLSGDVSALEGGLKKAIKGKKGGYATLASYGYVGSNGPDMFFVPPTITNTKLPTNTLSSLMHHNTVGAPVIYGLIELKKDIEKGKGSKEEQVLWMYKLAYWLGHITHIAADITVHPFVNSRAGANKLLQKKFRNFRGGTTMKVWTLHNVVEQYQDRYVLQNYYGGEDSFRAMAFGSMAALHLREKTKHRFIGKTIDEFYGQDYAGKQSWDKAGCKYEYSRAWYWLDSKKRSHMSFRNYLKTVVPSKAQLEKDVDFLVGPDDFKAHIKRATGFGVKMLTEAIEFLRGDTEAEGAMPRDQVYSVRKDFPLLYMNWNIDSGLCFKFHKCAETAGIGKDKIIDCRVPLRVELKTDKCLDDEPPDWPYAASPPLGAVVRQKSGELAVAQLDYRYWGVDVIVEGLKRGHDNAAFRVYAASCDDTDQDTVGKKIRGDEYNCIAWDKIASVSKDKLPGSDGVSRFSVLIPSRGPNKDYILDSEIKQLCEKMVVPTIGAPDVWERLGDGLFEKKMVKKSDSPRPTDQLFIKFHFIRAESSDMDEEETYYQRLRGGAYAPCLVPFEPGINNIAVVVDEKNKLKEVYLDLQKVWDADDD